MAEPDEGYPLETIEIPMKFAKSRNNIIKGFFVFYIVDTTKIDNIIYNITLIGSSD